MGQPQAEQEKKGPHQSIIQLQLLSNSVPPPRNVLLDAGPPSGWVDHQQVKTGFLAFTGSNLSTITLRWLPSMPSAAA